MTVDRWDMAADALDAAGFRDTAREIRGGVFYARTTVQMMRWATRRYVDQRAEMARALKCVKALARQVRHGIPW